MNSLLSSTFRDVSFTLADGATALSGTGWQGRLVKVSGTAPTAMTATYVARGQAASSTLELACSAWPGDVNADLWIEQAVPVQGIDPSSIAGTSNPYLVGSVLLSRGAADAPATFTACTVRLELFDDATGLVVASSQTLDWMQVASGDTIRLVASEGPVEDPAMWPALIRRWRLHWALTVVGATPILQAEHGEPQFYFSPDGAALAYQAAVETVDLTGQANGLVDPTFETISGTAVAIGTGATTSGHWSAHHVLNSGAAGTITLGLAEDRVSNSGVNPFSSAMPELRIYDVAGVFDADVYLYPDQDWIMTSLPVGEWLVAACLAYYPGAGGVGLPSHATVTLELYDATNSEVVATSPTRSVLAITDYAYVQLVAKYAATAAAFRASNWRWRLHFHADSTTGVEAGVSVYLGEPQLHFAHTATPLPYQPQLANWLVHAIEEDWHLTGEETSTLTGAQNNVALAADTSVFRWNGASAATFTGMTGGSDGRVVKLCNMTATMTLTLSHDTTSTAANRFYGTNAASVVIPPYGQVELLYDDALARWGMNDPAYGTPTTQAFGDAATAGTVATHKHAMPANPVSFGTPAKTTPLALSAAGAASSGIRSDAGIQSPGGVAATTANVAIANTETQVVGASLPADFMATGTTFRITANGIADPVATTANGTLRVRIGTSSLSGNIATTLAGAGDSAAVFRFAFEAIVTVRSAGAGGTVIGECSLTTFMPGAGTHVIALSGTTATVAVDTTAAKVVELTLISGDAGNTWTTYVASIEVVKM